MTMLCVLVLLHASLNFSLTLVVAIEFFLKKHRESTDLFTINYNQFINIEILLESKLYVDLNISSKCNYAIDISI